MGRRSCARWHTSPDSNHVRNMKLALSLFLATTALGITLDEIDTGLEQGKMKTEQKNVCSAECTGNKITGITCDSIDCKFRAQDCAMTDLMSGKSKNCKLRECENTF